MITEINIRTLKGQITKCNGEYDLNVSWFGYGKNNLYDILNTENLLPSIEKMRDGDKLVFNSNSNILK